MRTYVKVAVSYGYITDRCLYTEYRMYDEHKTTGQILLIQYTYNDTSIRTRYLRTYAHTCDPLHHIQHRENKEEHTKFNSEVRNGQQMKYQQNGNVVMLQEQG